MVGLAGALMVGSPAGLSGQQTPTSTQAPQFRAAIDLTRVDVTVLDRRTRQPVRGLTADDFIVRLSGQTREISAFAEVETRTAPRVSNPDAAYDVVSNAAAVERLIVIAMDDTYAYLPSVSERIEPFNNVEGRRVAHAIVDALGPGDRAAVIFSQDNRHAVDFTADRVVLRKAIDTYTLRSVHYRLAPSMSLGTLQRAREALLPLSGYRRSVAWITPGPHINLSKRMGEDDRDSLMNSIAMDDSMSVAMRQFQRIVRQGALSAVPIYAFSTAGLRAPTATDMRRGTMTTMTDTNVFMESIAAQSGGDAYVETNAPSKDVAQMFAELSSYYALGVAGLPARPGSLQRLEIAVKRPGVEVVPASLAFQAPDTSRLDDRPAASGLIDAFTSPLVTGGIALRLAALPIAVPNTRDQGLVLTLGLPAPATADGSDTYTVQTYVFDGEGRREILQQAQSVTITGGNDPMAEVALRLALRPGRYNVRAYVERAGTADAGSVFTQTTIPDFSRARVSVSGIALGRAEGRPVAGRESLTDLLPFAPTAVRTFAPTDRVGALWRVYAPTGPAADVTHTVQILDSAGAVVVSYDRPVPMDAFAGPAAAQGVEQRLELPLRTLPDGDYLLRIVASKGTDRVERDVRFSVER